MPHLHHNLAALAPHFPILAQAIADTPVPPDFLPTPGTDGTPTFKRILTTHRSSPSTPNSSPPTHHSSLIPPNSSPPTHPSSLIPHHSVQWLGQTSAPAATAPHIIASLDPLANGQNGLALSIGTGFEWLAFLAKLPRPQALFLYEPDLSLLRMALSICDLSAPLAARRLIPLTHSPDSAAQTLASFLTANPGINPPSVLHPLPSLPHDRRHQLLAAGELIVRHALSTHQQLLAQLQARLSLALSNPNPDPSPPIENQNSKIENPPTPSPLHPVTLSPCHVALLLSPRHPHERPLHLLLPPNTPTLFLDHHASAAPALRLQLLADLLSRGTVRILSDLFRHQLQPLPDQIPVETWIPPLVGPAFWDHLPTPSSLAPHDRIITHFAHHHSTLLSHHLPPSQLSLQPLSPSLCHPVTLSPCHPVTTPLRLALLADLPPSSPESLGIELPTHLSLYNAARDLILADFLAVHPASAPDLLRRALLRAGIDPQNPDPALNDPMLRILRHVLIPALPLLALVAALVKEGFPLTLLGTWPGLAGKGGGQTPLADIKYIPFDTYTTDAWSDVALCLHFSPTGTFSPLLFHAAAARIPLLSPQHPTDQLPGSLPTLLTPDSHFAHPLPKNLFPTLKSLLRDSPRRQKLASAALSALIPPNSAL